MNPIALLEGLLFIFGNEVVTLEELKNKLSLDEEIIIENIEFLKNKYKEDSNCALEIINVAKGFKLVTKSTLYGEFEALMTQFQSKPLSVSAMETLAIIAYKQPITRIEIEQIRGVACDNMIRKLINLELIQETGKAQTVGLPNLYGTTQYFLDYFNIVSIDELPSIEISETNDQDIDIFETKYMEVNDETE